MKIKRIEFQGYMAYGGGSDISPDTEALQSLELAALTLVFGKNNSGKSAAVRLPKLLLGGLECSDGSILPLEVRGLSYGNRFVDIVHGGAFFQRPTFRIIAERGTETLDFTVTLFIPNQLEMDNPPLIWSYAMREPETITIAGPGGDGHFQGLLPSETKWDTWRKAAKEKLDGMVHLGPTRARTCPAYENARFTGFGWDGSGAVQLLRTDSVLEGAVGAWYADHMEWRLSLHRDSASFWLGLNRGRISSINLARGGEGLQQVLPVVIHQLWRQQQQALSFLDIVEQPELHLHPAAQAPLADLFINTALQCGGQTLVETNSKAILLRLQRRVAERVIDPRLIALYCVETTDSGSQLRRVSLDLDGELDWWPSGVFEEDFDEVAAIRRAQRKHSGVQA